MSWKRAAKKCQREKDNKKSNNLKKVYLKKQAKKPVYKTDSDGVWHRVK